MSIYIGACTVSIAMGHLGELNINMRESINSNLTERALAAT
jgi:hypothetical protein